MSRLPSPQKIKSHRIYTVYEAAEALDKHRQTVVRWVNNMGLTADTTRKPWLIKGTDLKSFLGHRRQKVKCKLSLHHLYCLGCKGPQEPDGKIADYAQHSVSTGMLTALCPACGCIMNKIIRRDNLEALRAKIDVTLQQADARIVSRTDTPLNVTFNNKAETDVKARK
jgi:excisionase family DNA binding protein